MTVAPPLDTFYRQFSPLTDEEFIAIFDDLDWPYPRRYSRVEIAEMYGVVTFEEARAKFDRGQYWQWYAAYGI